MYFILWDILLKELKVTPGRGVTTRRKNFGILLFVVQKLMIFGALIWIQMYAYIVQLYIYM